MFRLGGACRCLEKGCTNSRYLSRIVISYDGNRGKLLIGCRFSAFPAAFGQRGVGIRFGPRECSKVMRCLLHPLLHPRAIPIDECISQLCIASGMAPKISAAVFSHRPIVSSSHRSMSHRLIVSSSHRRILSLPSHRHLRTAVTSSHSLIFTSSHRRTPPTVSHSLIVSSSLRLISSSSHPRAPSTIPHRLIAPSSHRLIVTPSHRLSFASSHHRRTP